jgi:HEAT repeat protein
MKIPILLAAAGLAAQTPPQVENAALQIHAVSGSVPAELKALGEGPYWAAWQEPIVRGHHGDMCDHETTAPVRLEGEVALLVMVRIENAHVDQIRIASPDCRFDGGGLAFHWLTGVTPSESVAWLKSQISEAKPERALSAIALHDGPAAERTLEELTAPSQNERVRSRAAFWLGSSRGAEGLEALKRMLANDPSPNVREQVAFALSVSREPSALATLIDEAKHDKAPQVRSKALFWLAQKASNKQTQDVIHDATLNDPDRSVKEQAVFALKQLPGDQGVPLLIDVAKNNPDPAIRKKAMFWLGESKDPRALDYFAQVLRQ